MAGRGPYPAGNLDEDVADEVVVGTQAIVELDRDTGAVRISYAAKRTLVKGLNLNFDSNAEFRGFSPAMPRFQPFDGQFAPSSQAVNVELWR